MSDCLMATNGVDKVRQLQRALYRKSKQDKGVRFYSLYDKVWRKDILWEAWRQVKANQGAPGVDGKAIDEIVNGGKLFASLGETRHVPGLKEIHALKDSQVSSAMAKDAAAVAHGKMKVVDFQDKYRAHLDTLIDPEHPDLGPKNNQLVGMWGRIEHGRIELLPAYHRLGNKIDALASQVFPPTH